MSYVSWYPDTSQERRNFFLRSFPMFIVMLVFVYFGLDWLGAFEFLEIMVRNNSAWLLKVIWGFEDYTTGFFQRRDLDPLTNSIISFDGTFPGIRLGTYPRDLLIIRACTGMEAGALLMALIFVTPAKWQNKTVAHVTNLLMMHIGNVFRVAFHFWYTQHLYQKFSLTMGSLEAADKAFSIAHDSLSKVFGFIGIVIFTLVIERTGVKIVSTFGAWIDAIADGFRGITGRVQNSAYYLEKTISYEALAKSEVEPIRIKQLDKKNFYPTDEIKNNRWNFFKNTFSVFVAVAIGIMALGLIPGINQKIGSSSDEIAIGFGANDNLTAGTTGIFWWQSQFLDLSSANNFVINIASSGILLFAICIAVIIVTPGKWRNKSIAMSITPFIIFPLNILRLGFQKWATVSLANFDTLKDSRPLLYLNSADMVTMWLPLVFWVSIFILLMFLFKKLQVKTFATMWSWAHQLIITIGWIVGLGNKPGKNEDDDKKDLVETKPSTSSE